MPLRAAAAAAAGRIAALLAPVADFVYPPVCLTCPRRLDERSAIACPACLAELTPADPGHPAWRIMEEGLRAEGGPDDFFALYMFQQEGKLQELLHLLKYRGFRRVGTGLGALLGAQLALHPAFRTADLIVPVPLHRRRLRRRGYNQSALIAAGAASASGIPVRASALARTRFTRSQTELSVRERRENVGGAFAASDASSLEGRRIILIDDVVTTGATIAAAARALRSARVAGIAAACVALAAPE